MLEKIWDNLFLLSNSKYFFTLCHKWRESAMYRYIVSNVNGCASETFHNILNIHCSYLILQQTSTRNMIVYKHRSSVTKHCTHC